MMLSRAIVSTEITGEAVSTPIVWLPDTVLPAASFPLTLTVRYHRPAPVRRQQGPSRSMRRLPHFCGIGSTVERDGKRRSLRQVLLVPDSVKPADCSLALITLSPAVVASVTLVSAVETVTLILPAEVVLLPSICTTDRYSPSARVGSVTVRAVLRDHGAGDGAAAAVFNLNGRARLPGTAEGGVLSSVTSFALSTPCLSPALSVSKMSAWRFRLLCIINNLRFGFAIAAVSQQCADRTAPNAAPAIQPHGASLNTLPCSGKVQCC